MKKLIPSILTLSNLLLGFTAILFTFKGEILAAILLVMLGLFCDFLDGYCARKLNAVSLLGKELDSLADLVTFAVAPAIMAYVASLHEIRMFGTACCLIYVCCGALRLARFNATQSHISGFVGMPTPLAAVFMLLLTASPRPSVVAFGTLLIGVLMISKISFPSLKK
ncbi:CDP-diacylglycerol--serine O-phosphatidyltransferase [Paenibacillus sp. FSL H7-0331]|nr:CDP-diacylglycerol--serine O-phosphatidyltransferase [Paenibacillus sp. FSL H7-0331]